MTEPGHDRYRIEEADRVIADRIAGGSAVLGIDGLWVRDGEALPDLDYIADFSPDGLTDRSAIAAVLQDWPQDDAFCVEIVFATTS